jgi:hypothetical protein
VVSSASSSSAADDGSFSFACFWFFCLCN